MATRRKSSPYAMSANLGSGVRTTTGGSYTNPRFGIEDYTAFGRGVASTFRVPEEQEEQKVAELELPTIDYVGAQKDTMLGDSQWMENSNLVSQLTSDLQPLKLQYEKCTKANDQQCLKNIGTTLNVIQTGQAQFQNMLTKYADSEIMDPETSRGQYMIGTDKKNIRRPDGSFLSLADITKVNNESPKDITMAVVDGKAVYKVKLDGTSYNVNLSDLTENYLTNNFDIRSDIGLDVQAAMRSGGFTSDWKDKPTMYSSQTSETTEDGVSIKTLKGYEGIVSGTGYFENANDRSKTFSNNLYKTISSPNVNSAFNKLTARIYNGNFKSDEINALYAANPQLAKAKDLSTFREQIRRVPNNIKLSMLQDEAEQEWLIANASNGHRRGDDGRAERLDKNYLIKTSTTTKPITEDEGSGSGFNSDNAFDAITTLFGEGRMAGGGQRAGTFKAEEFDLDGAVKYFNDKDSKGNTFFNLYNDQALKDLLATDDLNEDSRKQINNIIRQKSPGSKNRLIGYVDKNGDIQISKFDGTIASFINEVSTFGAFSSKEKSALRNRVDEIYKKGSDIAEYTDPNDAPPPLGPITPRS
tara:strand:+ start:461 stop:2215 length:1755 start_codon:yes stop_codon:yes gene_type:complete